MSLSHRVGSRAANTAGAADVAADSPPASRQRVRRWTDPRLWIGVLLVLASIVIGASILDSANDTQPVWRVRQDVTAGSAITAADVELTNVHFEGSSSLLYLSANDALPADARLTRDLSAGELLAASAITTDTTAAPELLPLGVAGSGVPAGLAPGDRVDVWALAAVDDRRAPPPARVLTDVTVSAVSAAGPGGLDAERQILVALPNKTDVGAALAALNGASVVLIQSGS